MNTFFFSLYLVPIIIWTEKALILRRRPFFLVSTYFWTENPLILQGRPFIFGLYLVLDRKRVPPQNPTPCATILSNATVHPLAWRGKNEKIFRSSSQAATCLPVNHARWRLYIVHLMLKVKQGRCEYCTIFYRFWLDPTRNRIRFTVSVRDVLSTRLIIGFKHVSKDIS